jgi:LPS O-antigen subunit length determinant protein (WzzB/FepE family)
MKDAENAIKVHRESAGNNASKFISDDTFAMKFANELNIKKMRVNYIQSTFDKIMAEAFNVVRGNGNDQRVLRNEYKKIVTRFLRDYENGKTMLTQIQDGLAARIDYAIEEAHRMSQVSESAELVTDEMEAEAIALEEALKAQLSARIEEIDKHTDDVIIIGNRRIDVIRS